jgi:hypothetical protein
VGLPLRPYPFFRRLAPWPFLWLGCRTAIIAVTLDTVRRISQFDPYSKMVRKYCEEICPGIENVASAARNVHGIPNVVRFRARGLGRVDAISPASGQSVRSLSLRASSQFHGMSLEDSVIRGTRGRTPKRASATDIPEGTVHVDERVQSRTRVPRLDDSYRLALD